MRISDVLQPKKFDEIRKIVPGRFSLAIISGELYDMRSGEKYKEITYMPDKKNINSEEELFNRIIDDYNNCDEIATDNEIYDGSFHYKDFIVLTELFTNKQKWDLTFCRNIFNGENTCFTLHVINKSKKTDYYLVSKSNSYFDRIAKLSKDLRLLNLHQEFAALGGSHETISRFTDLVERAGWEIGIKMIRIVIDSIKVLQEEFSLGNRCIFTKLDDELLADDYYILYSITPGIYNHQIKIKHLFHLNITKVRMLHNRRVFKKNKIVW